MKKKDLLGIPHDAVDVRRSELLGLHESPARGIESHDPHYAAMLAIEAAKKAERAIDKLNKVLAKISVNGSTSGSGSGTGTGTEGGNTIVVNTPSVKSAFVQVYKASATKPDTPTGGSYNFSASTLTPPTGWSKTNNFNNEVNVWMSYNTYYTDGTCSGWSEPLMCLDYETLFNKISEEVQEIYDNLLEDADSNLNQVIADANAALASANQKIEAARVEILNAKNVIATANSTITDARNLLDTLETSTGNQGIKEALGKVEAFADWYDKESGNIYNLSFSVNSLRGEIRQLGTNINTTNNTITNLQTILSAKDEQIEDRIERIDGSDGTVANLSRTLNAKEAAIYDRISKINTAEGSESIAELESRMDAVEASITDSVNIVDPVTGNTTTVKQELSGLKSTVTTKVQKIDTIEGTVNTLDAQMNGTSGKISLLTTKANTAYSTASEALTKANSAQAALVDITPESISLQVQNKVDEFLGDSVGEAVNTALAAGTFSITPTQIIQAISAQGADGAAVGAAIIQRINGGTGQSETVISANKVVIDGQTIAETLATETLQVGQDNDTNQPTSVFNKEGDGYVANGNIQWDAKGNVVIGGGLININPDGTLGSTSVSELPQSTVLLTTSGANPFGDKWRSIGTSMFGNILVTGYEKYKGGSDQWQSFNYKPNYSDIDTLHVAIMDETGKFWTVKSEWVSAGSPRIAGIAFSNGAIRFCFDPSKTLQVNEGDGKFGMYYANYMAADDVFGGYPSENSNEYKKTLEIIRDVQDYLPATGDGGEGSLLTNKILAANAKYMGYTSTERQYVQYSMMSIVDQVRAMTPNILGAGKSFYIPSSTEAELIKQYRTEANAMYLNFTGVSTNPIYSYMKLSNISFNQAVGSWGTTWTNEIYQYYYSLNRLKLYVSDADHNPKDRVMPIFNI